MAQDNLTKRNPMSTILITLVAIVAIFIIVIAMQPSEFRVTRTVSINAAPEAVFEQINDFHKWQAWSPWAKLDPTAKNTFGGAESGTGAIFGWEGNREIGSGVMTITESRPYDLIRIKLEFQKPFTSLSTTEFTLAMQNNQTNVTWNMYGQKNFMSKAMGLFMDCEKMVSDQFDLGLTNIKAIVEADAAKNIAPAPATNEGTIVPEDGSVVPESVTPLEQTPTPEGTVVPDDTTTTAPAESSTTGGTTTPNNTTNNPQ